MLFRSDKFRSFSSRNLFRGAAVLTAAGLITRIMGFFFRIFLSHAFGEENVGLYQLIFPVYALCLSVSTFGIQTAVSHMVAEKMSSVVTYSAASSSSPHIERQKEAGNILAVSLGFTLFLSLIELYFLQKNAFYIATTFLGDARCENLLLIVSYALPFAAIHSCICGYSLGLQQTKIPALSQLIEQSARILFVVLLFLFVKKPGKSLLSNLPPPALPQARRLPHFFDTDAESAKAALLCRFDFFHFKNFQKTVRFICSSYSKSNGSYFTPKH